MQHRNRILGKLPLELLQPQLVQLRAGTTVHQLGGAAKHVYFPTSSVVSLLVSLESGDATEWAVVGNEGVIGCMLLTGGRSSQFRALVQESGDAYRVRLNRLMAAFERDSTVRAALLDAIGLQMMQGLAAVACNRFHTLEAQLCRAILERIDRAPARELTFTQQAMANVLGRRRAGVSIVAQNLRALGAIRYRRGRLEVVSRSKLEQRACECYKTLRRELQKAAG